MAIGETPLQFSSNLRSRVIQMVIDKNLTLADACKILTLLLTNKTGNVTVFAYLATSQFHTLGFAWRYGEARSSRLSPCGTVRPASKTLPSSRPLCGTCSPSSSTVSQRG